jgi:integrase/recombinase XerD
MDWIADNPFKKYQITYSKSTRTFLNEEELVAIETKEFDLTRLEIIRDIFVFSCYTGLAYIDLKRLTTDHISVGMDGEKWIHFMRQKTSTPFSVPLLPKALELVEKYKDHPRSFQDQLLPVFSNQKTNAYLKEIATLCGVKKTLTFHIARHTFATTVTLTNGVPIETVSKMLGHTKLATTQIYAKVVESKIGEDMAMLKAKLAGKLVKREAQ